jgi:hypothetical protein
MDTKFSSETTVEFQTDYTALHPPEDRAVHNIAVRSCSPFQVIFAGLFIMPVEVHVLAYASPQIQRG